jgi:hypothetical protein
MIIELISLALLMACAFGGIELINRSRLRAETQVAERIQVLQEKYEWKK